MAKPQSEKYPTQVTRPRFVQIASTSAVTPGGTYLDTIAAISEDGGAWFHSDGQPRHNLSPGWYEFGGPRWSSDADPSMASSK